MAAVTGGGAAADPEEEGGARREMRSTTRAMQMETGDMTASTSAPRVSRTVAAVEVAAGEAAAGSMRRRGGGGGEIFPILVGRSPAFLPVSGGGLGGFEFEPDQGRKF